MPSSGPSTRSSAPLNRHSRRRRCSRRSKQPNPNRDDTTLILGDLAEKALRQVHETVRKLLLEHHTEADAERIATALADGQWTHDYPLDVEELRELGIEVGTELPRRPSSTSWTLSADEPAPAGRRVHPDPLSAAPGAGKTER